VPATSANSLDNTLRAVAADPARRKAWAAGDYQAGAVGALEKTLTEVFAGQLMSGHPNIFGRQQTS
jgi:hypothetical protein